MKLKVDFVYKSPKGLETSFHSEELTPEKALLLIEDLQKTGRMKQYTLYDEYETTWSMKELKKYVEELEEEPHDFVIYFDGGFDVQTKKSGLGIVVYYEQEGKQYRVRKNALVEELQTNSEAEYAALHLAVKELETFTISPMSVTFIGDSQGVVNQLKDEWPCYEEELLRWIERIEARLNELRIKPEFRLVPRNKNQEADHLATQALIGVEVSSKTEIN